MAPSAADAFDRLLILGRHQLGHILRVHVKHHNGSGVCSALE